MNLIPPDASCPGCREVIQICLTPDGYNVVKCQQIPVDVLVNGVTSPTLTEMMPTLFACGGLMTLAWVFKVMINHIILK